MVDFKGLVGKFLMATIILISLMSVIVVLQDDNNAQQKLSDNNIFNESFGGITQIINESTNEANEKYGTFNNENPKPGFGSIVLFGIVSVGKTFSNIAFGYFVALIKLPLIVLGLPITIYNLVLVWLTIIVIIAAWLLYKLGS